MLCLHHLEQIPKQIELQVKTGLEFSAGRKILAEKINVSRQDISSYQKECERILTKYSAVPDNLEDRIKESLSNKDAKVNVHRGLWEEIFKGFTMWVDSIPDYTQEKEIYLKNYINGCNVVGISCTENMRVLDDKGFDDFDVVIIDEVSKATPPELLLPMLRGRKVVLVGDHRQLPPLFNEHEKTYREMLVSNGGDKQFEAELTIEDFKKYEKLVTSSLFEEYFENAPDDIKATLTIQYRMHEEIMDIINHFYDGYLLDGYEDMYTEDTKAHYLDIKTRTGYNMIVPEHHAYWIDSSTLWGERICEQQKEGSTSFENIVEAEIILELLRKIEFQYANNKTITSPVTVGVISFYFDQVSLLRNMIKKESFNSIDVEVNTVDRFQGKEKEVILVSLVRNSNSKKRSTGSYIAAFQRINVAFSRAQNLLLIVGSKDMYMNQPVELNDMNTGKVRTEYIYKEILHLLDERGTYFKGEDILSETRIHKILEYLDKKKE